MNIHFGQHDRQYERPNNRWQCGGAQEGQPCPLGPDLNGQCRADYECLPIRKGDRWYCTRITEQGGSCAQGPLPEGQCACPLLTCLPIRSLAYQRSRAIRVAVLLALGLVLILLSAPIHVGWLSPGALPTHHANMTCSQCHTTTDPQARLTALAQSAQCLHCHTLGKHPLEPHGLPPDFLTKKLKSDYSAGPWRLRLANQLQKHKAQGMTCTLCHPQHTGQLYSPPQLQAGQCQSCHRYRFKRFSQGHPVGASLAKNKIPSIYFDHTRHQARNPANPPTTLLCQGCHLLDQKNQTASSSSFEKNCMGCHKLQPPTSHPGVRVLAVPALDLASLSRLGARIGEWPARAEGTLTPFMHLLLSGDPEFRTTWLVLQKMELLDLGTINAIQQKAIEDFVRAFKTLLYELKTEGPVALQRRLQIAIGRPFGKSESQALYGDLPADTLLLALQTWFPSLSQELAQGKNQGLPPLYPIYLKNTAKWSLLIPSSSPYSSWSRQPFSLNYHLRNHGDIFFKAWLDLSAPAAMRTDRPLQATIFGILADAQPKLTKCQDCHRLERQKSGLKIHWRRIQDQAFSLSRFSHQKHLNNEQKCHQCHQWPQYSEVDGPVETRSMISDPLEQGNCVHCHHSKGVGEACQLCHNYHAKSSG